MTRLVPDHDFCDLDLDLDHTNNWRSRSRSRSLNTDLDLDLDHSVLIAISIPIPIFLFSLFPPSSLFYASFRGVQTMQTEEQIVQFYSGIEEKRKIDEKLILLIVGDIAVASERQAVF